MDKIGFTAMFGVILDDLKRQGTASYCINRELHYPFIGDGVKLSLVDEKLTQLIANLVDELTALTEAPSFNYKLHPVFAECIEVAYSKRAVDGSYRLVLPFDNEDFITLFIEKIQGLYVVVDYWDNGTNMIHKFINEA